MAITKGRMRSKRRTTGSIASSPTVPSKRQSEVLGLGKHLVSELGLENSNDTLGRWMAHHVAELIAAAKGAKNKAQRAVAEERAVKTILKLWEHRTTLPGHAYPLAQFREILDLLSKLIPAANPWYRQAQGERQQLSLNLFNDLTQLTNLLLSLDVRTPHFTSAHTPKLLGDFLSPEEGDVYITLRRLVGLETNASDPVVSTNSGNKEETPAICELRHRIALTQKHLDSLLRVLDRRADSGRHSHEGSASAE